MKKLLTFCLSLFLTLLLAATALGAAAGSVIYGDVNGDGQINAADLAMLRMYLAALDPTTGTSSVRLGSKAVEPASPITLPYADGALYADANGDGRITAADLAMLRQYLANYNVEQQQSSVVLGPKCDHQYDEKTNSATCTASGIATYTCSKCGASYQEQSLAKGHRFETVVETEASCTEDGARYLICSGCGLDQMETIPALGHDFSAEWTVDVAATDDKDGEQSRHCTRCSARTDITVIPRTGGPRFTYTVNSDGKTCTVTGMSEESWTAITIPEKIDGYTVTAIGRTAFDEILPLKTVTLPSTVKTIERSAFYGCTNLSAINLPNGLTEIGYKAFYGCSALKSVELPDSVTTIGSYAFYNCSAMETLRLSASAKLIDKCAFSGCSSLKTLVIPQGVTTLGESAFQICSALTSVTMPDSLTTIGATAFASCNSLKSLTVGKNVTSIGHGAFSACKALTEIRLPSKITTITENFFYRDAALTDIYFAGTQAAWMGLKKETGWDDQAGDFTVHCTDGDVPANAFSEGLVISSNGDGTCTITGIGSCTDTDIFIPDWINGLKVTGIGEDAFAEFCDLTSVTIPDSVTSIGCGAFYDCWSLTSITIPDSVTSIGDYAFYNCSSLTSITIPDSVTSIGYYAFYNCSGLTSITIGNGVTSIGGSAFSGCSSLQYTTYGNAQYLGNADNPYVVLVKAVSKDISSCKIHPNTKIIYSDAFIYCSKLSSITIPDGVTSIKTGTFYYCSSLTSITIGNGVTSIGGYAFRGCFGLTSITIPDSVTSIGSYAFDGCSGLTSITIPDSVTSIGSPAFYGCSGLTSIKVEQGNPVYHSTGNCLIETASKTLILGCKNSVIPVDGSVTSIGNHAFRGCSGLTSITIPDSVTSIEAYAFYDCSGLTSITIPDSVTSIEDYAFYGCSGLTSITFEGSKAQWNSISKGSYWNYDTGKYTIHCIDGNIAK